jgi:hypothetical protein
MTAKTVGKKKLKASVEKAVIKSIKKNKITSDLKIKIKKTRCQMAIDDIISMAGKCEKGTEQIEFYTFTTLDQCLKRLTNICPQN